MEGRELSLVIEHPAQGQFLKRIDWNREEFMALVQSAMERYEGMTFTEDQVKAAKEERAQLNALKKAISNRRIQIKNEVMTPYNQFEAEVQEIVVLIDRPIGEIDRQIRAFEERKKAEKKDALRARFAEIAGDLDGILTFERVFDRRYLNVSVTLAKAKKDIADKVERVRADLGTIDTVEEAYRLAVKDAYLRTLDLGKAMGEMARMKELRRQELVRQEEARKATEGKAVEATAQTDKASAVPAPAAAETVAPPVRTETGAMPHEDAQDVPPVQASFINPAKRYQASFTVYGSREQILSVRQFLVDNGIEFRKAVR